MSARRDEYAEIRGAYLAEGSDAVDPLQVDWLIREVGHLRDVVAFQDQVLAELSDLPAGLTGGET